LCAGVTVVAKGPIRFQSAVAIAGRGVATTWRVAVVDGHTDLIATRDAETFLTTVVKSAWVSIIAVDAVRLFWRRADPGVCLAATWKVALVDSSTFNEILPYADAGLAVV
jgi:hypothetical protein